MGTKKTKYVNNMYVGAIAATQRKEIDRAIRRGTFIPGLYLITFAANGYDQLDIMHARYLLEKRVRKELPLIAGIAGEYGQGNRLLCRRSVICERMYREQGGDHEGQGQRSCNKLLHTLFSSL